MTKTTTRAWTRLQRAPREPRPSLNLLNPKPTNGHWVADVVGREPAYDTADTLHNLCWALSREARYVANAEADAAVGLADVRDYEGAWKARQRADALFNLGDNLDFDTRVSAPLFSQPVLNVARRNLRDSMLHAIGLAITANLISAAWVCNCNGSRCGHGWDE